MAEVCVNGHTRTEANTRWHKRGRGDQLKRVCLDCKSLRYQFIHPSAAEIQAQLTTDRHEDVEDLLRLGVDVEEVVQRSGYSTLKRLKTSLRRRERDDLLELVENQLSKMS